MYPHPLKTVPLEVQAFRLLHKKYRNNNELKQQQRRQQYIDLATG